MKRESPSFRAGRFKEERSHTKEELPKAIERCKVILEQVFPEFSKESLKEELDKLNKSLSKIEPENQKKKDRVNHNWLVQMVVKHDFYHSVPTITFFNNNNTNYKKPKI